MTEENRMSEYDDLFAEFPAEVRWLLRDGWNALSPERQAQLTSVLPALAGSSADGLKRLFELGKNMSKWRLGISMMWRL